MPLSIIVRVVSQVYEKCIYYTSENPKSKAEEILRNVILSRYENMRLRIVNGGCDTDVGLKSIENSLLEVIVYEQQYQCVKHQSRCLSEDKGCCIKMPTLEKCQDETDMLDVAVNLNLSYTEFKNNVIYAEDRESDDEDDAADSYDVDNTDDTDDIYS